MPNSLNPLLPDIAQQFGTPCYVYSAEKIDTQCKALLAAFEGTKTQLCFATKANSTSAILRRIFGLGFGADVVSGGELQHAVECGAKRVVFSGVGKQNWEIELGIQQGAYFNVESADELGRIHEAAARLRKKASVLLRVNPNIPVQTNPYIATGLYATKFGISENQLESAVLLARSLPSLSLLGLGCHLGSQLTDLKVFEEAALRMTKLIASFRQGHPEFRVLDLGGGLAVRYQEEKPPTAEAYAKTLLGPVQKGDLELILEPGRWVVAESGLLLTRVITVKATPEKRFVVVDAGMNDLLRPSLYEAFHPIWPVKERTGAAVKVDVVGPVCETGDFLGLDRKLAPLEAGDLLCVGVAGAYGSTMASTYNSRPRAAEVLVENSEPRLIRKREPQTALWSLDL